MCKRLATYQDVYKMLSFSYSLINVRARRAHYQNEFRVLPVAAPNALRPASCREAWGWHRPRPVQELFRRIFGEPTVSTGPFTLLTIRGLNHVCHIYIYTYIYISWAPSLILKFAKSKLILIWAASK